MASKSYREVVVAWALHRLQALVPVASEEAPPTRARSTKDAGESAARWRGKSPPAPTDAAVGAAPVAAVVARFGLDERERQVLDLAFAVESALEVARVARAIGGGRGLTVELVRE